MQKFTNIYIININIIIIFSSKKFFIFKEKRIDNKTFCCYIIFRKTKEKERKMRTITNITLSEIKSLNKEEFQNVCLTHGHPEQWENQDAYEWAINNLESVLMGK